MRSFVSDIVLMLFVELFSEKIMPDSITLQREITVSATMKETVTLSNDALRNAVRTKDRRFDGVFWFAVKTTGIYCRPSCSSREAKAENIIFIESPEAAQKQGFRACKRCKPDQMSFPDEQLELIQRICVCIAEQITEKPDESPHLEVIGEILGVSGDRVQRIFTSVLGISPKEFADSFRLHRFKHLVKSSETVTEAMYKAGYGSSSRLYEKSDALLGMTPASYKKNGKGAVICAEATETRLGYVLVAATERGICSVTLGDNPRAMYDELQGDFEEAVFTANKTAQFYAWNNAIVNFIETMSQEAASRLLSLPLDIQKTAFQAKVWSALRAIPCGETRSYSEVAESIGQPTASRAVAQACASNPVALLTPCHRVIRAGGDVSGYRWGVKRKEVLLTGEKAK